MINNTQDRYVCKICGNRQEIKPLAVLKGKYRVLKCDYCTLETVDPLPADEELSGFYNSYHFTAPEWPGPSKMALMQKMHNKIADCLLSKINEKENPKFLDYGFGRGYFLKCLAEKGIAASGVEYSEENCRQLEIFFKDRGMVPDIIKLVPNA